MILDCKGGADARRIADRCRRVLRESGARNVAVWPDEARLSLWALPARQLVTTLVDLIEHGTGGAAYYADVMEAVVALAVEAPGGPPASTAGLPRPAGPWLARAAPGSATRTGWAWPSAARQVPDIALRFRTLFRRLGAGARRAWQLRRRRRLVLHPGGNRRGLRRRGSGPRAGRPARQLCRPAGPSASTARSCSPSMSSAPSPGGCPIWQLYRAGAFAGPGRPGLGPVVARPGRPRRRPVPAGRYRRRRDLAAAHPASGAADGAGRPARGHGQQPAAHRPPALEPARNLTDPGRAGRGPGPRPRAWTSVRSPTCTRVAPRSPRSSAWWPDRRRWRPACRAAAVSCRIPGRGGGTASASTARAGRSAARCHGSAGRGVRPGTVVTPFEVLGLPAQRCGNR